MQAAFHLLVVSIGDGEHQPVVVAHGLAQDAVAFAVIETIQGLVQASAVLFLRQLAEALLRPDVSLRARELRVADPSPDPSVLLWQAGQIVAGQETLIAQLLLEAGFESHAQDQGLGQADYVTLEQVLSDPPDLLLVAGDSAGQQHPALAHQGVVTEIFFFSF